MATDYYQLRVQGLHQTEYNECVLHFRGTNLTAADYMQNAIDLCESFNDALVDRWLDLLPETYQLLRLTAKKASAGGGGEATKDYSFASKPGTISSHAASQQLCPSIILIPPMGIKTAGKIFLPAIAVSSIGANAVTAGWLTELATFMTTMMGGFAFSSITWDSAIYSRKNGSFAETTDYSTSPIVGFQRRRQRSPL